MKFEYEYSNLSEAGSVIGLLYESDPNYAPPDPSDPNCTLAKADHLGFVRYSTCNVDYLKTTIQVNEDGRYLIMATVAKGAKEAIPVWPGWVALGFGVFILVAAVAGKAESGGF